MSWWTPTRAGVWWTAQPVSHLVGGVYWPLALIGVVLVPWWLRPAWLTGVFAAWWQLLAWEWAPDGTYPWRWLVFNVLTEVLTAGAVTGIVIALGVRWP